jgi:uncharacterized protein (DUF362 family)/Pyruvate/2-oxoacid:ferredoxin oxidoreductase delta subunit
MGKRAIVSIVRVSDSIEGSVRKAVDLIGGIPAGVTSETRVLIKPNFIRAEAPAVGTTTHPEIVRTVATMFKEKGARVAIGEASGNQYNTEEIFEHLRIRDRLGGFEVLDLDRDRIVSVEIRDARALKKVGIAETVLNADLIVSLPVMKTHNSTVFTGAMKNMMGVLPEREKWNMHLSGLHEALVDLNRAVGPRLIVMDAIVAMEGWGPAMGYPVKMGLVLAGTDFVAVDSVAAAIMGIELKDVKHLVRATEEGLGVSDLSDIEIRGEEIVNVKRRFRKAPGVKFFEVYGKCQYTVGRFLLNSFRIDIRPFIRRTSLFHLPKPKLDYGSCTRTGRCRAICPESAITMNSYPVIDYSKCSRCMLCYEQCPQHAILVSRLPVSVLKLRNQRYGFRR